MSKTSQISKTQPCSFLKAYGPLCNTGACSPCIGTAHTRGVSPGRDTLSRKTHNTNAFFCTAFPRHKKDAGCGGGPKSSNSSAKTCHGGCVLGGCGGPSTRRPQFAYLHTLILLSPHLPQVHSQRHHALSPDLPHKHCSCHTWHARARANTDFLYTYFGHTCHAHKHATLHIYSCHTCHTQNHICSYILAAPATEKHKPDKRKQNKKTNQKLPQSLEQRFFGGSSMLIAPIAIDMHGSVFWSLELLRFRTTSTKKIPNFVCNTHGSWKTVLSPYFPETKTLKTTMVNLQSWSCCDVQVAT